MERRVGEGFTGLIDELRIYNIAVGVTNVFTRQHSPFQGSELGLVALYNFEDGTEAGRTEGHVEDFLAANAAGVDYVGNPADAAVDWQRVRIDDADGAF